MLHREYRFACGNFTKKSDFLIKSPAKFFIFAGCFKGLKVGCSSQSMRYTENSGSVPNRFSAVADAGGVGTFAVHVGI